MSWDDIAGKRSKVNIIRRLLEEWCIENGKDYYRLLGNSTIVIWDTVDGVDKGRIIALANARWPIKEIAVDCHCTERCVKEVLDNTPKRRKGER